MKHIILSAVALVMCAPLMAQNEEKPQSPYTFETQVEAPTTPVKNQQRAGTCWAYATLATIESDLLKAGKGEADLSEMWIVRHIYMEKAEKYVRLHGQGNFSQGGNAHDILIVLDKYGIVPEQDYLGLEYGADTHLHSEVEAVMLGYLDAVIKNKNRELSTAWKRGFNAILDSYFGELPETITVGGKKMTPKEYAKHLGLKGSDYVTLTSFTHHPFDSYFNIEIPDNWAWLPSYNIPLDEFVETLDYILKGGYSVCWASDVSEKGFQYKKGFAVLPVTKAAEISDLEEARWTEMNAAELNAKISSFEEVVPEIKVSQELRQEWFDNYQTTDDHGMQLYGIATTEQGAKFYLVKNSWGTDHIYGGMFYASQPFVEGKTINYLVNVNALPKALRKRMGR